MKVLVIGGGISPEREVSLRSAQAVSSALKTSHTVKLYDWDGGEEWLAAHVGQFDVVFPVLHGEGGEDGQIQAVLERCDVPYVGSDVRTSKLCMDKWKTRQHLAAEGILVPDGEVVSLSQYQVHPLRRTPHVLKPIAGGSSIDMLIFPKMSAYNQEKAYQLFSTYPQLLLEEYVNGTEITVPVLENSALPVIEIVPPSDGVFDYQNKYNGATAELCPPRSVALKIQKQAQQLAERCHAVLGCRDLSRTDMLVSKDQLYVLEVNTMPGMTEQSLFPKSAAQAGVSLSDLSDRLIQSAYRRK